MADKKRLYTADSHQEALGELSTINGFIGHFQLPQGPSEKKITLIVNPISGGGRAYREAPWVRARLLASGWQVKLVVPRSEFATTNYVAGLEPGTIVGALGGDGLLARVCEGALRSGAWVLPIPSGRGNDMCRALGIYGSPENVARRAYGFVPRQIDVGLANGKLFLGAVSVGFDSLVCERANRFKILRGSIVYTAAALLVMLKLNKAFNYRITVDGRTRAVKGWLTAVSNSGIYGGGMHICSESRLEDGSFEAVTIDAPGRASFISAIKDMFAGTVLQRPQVTWVRGCEFEIHTDRPMIVYADGDYVCDTPVKISCLPQALTFLVPPHAQG